MTDVLGQTWRVLRDRFATAGIETAALDARLLVRHVLDLDETGLIARESEPFPEQKRDDLEALAARRLAGEPMARIFGRQEFYGFAFGLNPATLIPRPETEMLVDFGLDVLKTESAAQILDLGTGTGCIVLSLLANLPGARGVGIDIAPAALDMANHNAKALGLSERFTTLGGDWFSPLEADARFDLIVSNPPYIASAVIETLAPGVRVFDPGAALDGGIDGLAPYRIIAAQGAGFLKPGGRLALEIGFDQAQMVKGILQDAGWQTISVYKDIAGHDRMVVASVSKA